jgi:hypothetical protein
MNFSADAEGVSADRIVEKLIEDTPAQASGISRDPEAARLTKV